MAKKKVTHQGHHPTHKENGTAIQNQHQDHTKDARQAMEDSEEKLQSLKSLNAMLLKETHERRQQVETLEQAKEALEAALARCGVEKEALQTQLSGAAHESAGLEIEKGVLRAFVETQLTQMGVEMEKAKTGRDAEIGSLKEKLSELANSLESEMKAKEGLRNDLDSQVQESNGLREEVVALEERERKLQERVRELDAEHAGLLEAKAETERVIEELRRKKDAVEGNLESAVREIERFKREVEAVAEEKEEVEKENRGQSVRIGELERELEKLSEIVLDLRKEEEVLRATVLGLEQSYSEAMEKEKDMGREITALVEEKRETARIIEMLTEEKASVTAMLDSARKECQDKDLKMEDMMREKIEVEQVKSIQESEISELHKHVDELRATISALQEACSDQKENKERLLSEVGQWKDALDGVTRERDEARKLFDGEKKSGVELKSKIVELERSLKETVEELGKIRTERESLLEQKKDIETRCELLGREQDVIQHSLSEAQKSIDDLKGKLESTSLDAQKTLNVLKMTYLIVCQSEGEKEGKEEVDIGERNLEEDSQEPYMLELEAIKKAFRDKENMLENMRQQLESLQNSVVDARKKKSLWTTVSCAATFFAAVSAAYVARGH